MGTRTLRVDDVGVTAWEAAGSRPAGGLLRRFRHFIEYSDWDERFMEFVDRIDRAFLIAAVAAALYVASAGIRSLP